MKLSTSAWLILSEAARSRRRQLEGVQRGLAIGLAQHGMQRLGGIGSRDGSLIKQGVELFAGTENGLQREH